MVCRCVAYGISPSRHWTSYTFVITTKVEIHRCAIPCSGITKNMWAGYSVLDDGMGRIGDIYPGVGN
jgi:hypothetical protein